MVVTFLPFEDFEASVKSLDNKRLGKQRVEAKQIINILEYLDGCVYVDDDDDGRSDDGGSDDGRNDEKNDVKKKVLVVDEKYRQTVFYGKDTPFNTKSQYTKDVVNSVLTLGGPPKGQPKGQRKVAWINHPAVKMWYRYTNALKEYYNHCLQEWLNRGCNNTMEFYDLGGLKIKYPWWLGWDKVHFSHMASLNRKDPSYYKFDVPEEYMKYTYVWPISRKMKKRKDDKLEQLTKLF